jgi:AI-2 transport protein TqsA
MSSRNREQLMLITASLVVLAAIAIAFILWFTQAVMVPFVLAVFVVAVVAPLADFLELRAGFHRWMSMSLVLVLVLAVTAAWLLLFTYTAQEVAVAGSVYARKLYDVAASKLNAEERRSVERDINDITAKFGEPTTILSHEVTEDSNAKPDSNPTADTPPIYPPLSLDWIKQESLPLLKGMMARLLVAASRSIGSILSVITTFFLMLFFALFLLSARGPRNLQNATYADIESKIRSYVGTLTAISAATAILVGLILWAFGLQLAVVFAVLVFVLNFIPSLGSIIATLLPIPIAYAQFIATADTPHWWALAGVIAIPATIHMLIGYAIEPRIMGEGLELDPVTILFALAFWGLLWGPVGAILAVPITAVIRIILTRFESFKLITDAMAGTLPGRGNVAKA